MDEKEAVEQFVARLPLWQEFVERIRSVLEDVARNDSRIASVAYRIKSVEAIFRTLNAAKIADLAEVSDIVGVRILVYKHDDIRPVARLLRRTLGMRVSDEHSWRDEPRYRSVHMVFEVGEDREHLVEWRPFVGLQAEIRLQTLLASAWDQVRHFLYKMDQGADGRPGDRSQLTDLLNAPPYAKLQAGADVALRLEAVVDQFEELLERPGVHEKRDIHSFIEMHEFILHPNPEDMWSEVPIGIGTEWRVDFLILEPEGSYMLVEIENPRHRLFTKGGNFTAIVGHAQVQIEDWQEWIEDNLPSMQKKFVGISSPRGLLVIGRSKGLSHGEVRRLARRNVNLRGRVAIRTYDDLIASARAYAASIRRHLTA